MLKEFTSTFAIHCFVTLDSTLMMSPSCFFSLLLTLKRASYNTITRYGPFCQLGVHSTSPSRLDFILTSSCRISFSCSRIKGGFLYCEHKNYTEVHIPQTSHSLIKHSNRFTEMAQYHFGFQIHCLISKRLFRR